MAKYIGLLTSDVRGKLGGVTFSRARGATTLSAKALQSGSRSQAQRDNSQGFVAALPAWRALTAANRLTWTNLAATLTWTNSLGTTWTPTGLQLWTQCYVNASYFGYTPPSIAPLSAPLPPPIVGCALVVSPPSARLEPSWALGVSAGPFYAAVSRPINPGITYTKSVSKCILASSYGSSFVDIYGAMQRQYGVSLLSGMTVAVRLQTVYPGTWNSGTPFIASVTGF